MLVEVVLAYRRGCFPSAISKSMTSDGSRKSSTNSALVIQLCRRASMFTVLFLGFVAALLLWSIVASGSLLMICSGWKI